MASIGKITASALSIPNELTVAAAAFNIDFSLFKVEAPQEFHGVRNALSIRRIRDAEGGQHHITARQLGALFEAKVPAIPNLISRYGSRVSEICSRIDDTAQESGPFADQIGPDGLNIWAGATSGIGGLATHLLACLLARVWKPHQATSLWVEIVERRKQEIVETLNLTSTAEAASLMASQQIISRQQLAAWDASARAWLHTADRDRRHQHIQLNLIMNNLQLPVSTIHDPYESVMEAWISALRGMELLVQGISQRVSTGSILLAMSSWHLYPDLEVLLKETASIYQNDCLMCNSIVTVSYSQNRSSERQGVSWSLPLSRMKFYSHPITTEGSLSLDTSRVTMEEFCIAVLGIVIGPWKQQGFDHDISLKMISRLAEKLEPNVPLWLKMLANHSSLYLKASGLLKKQYTKLLGRGVRRGRGFLYGDEMPLPPCFGLTDLPTLLNFYSNKNGSTPEAQIRMLRKISWRLELKPEDVVIRYKRFSRPGANADDEDWIFEYTSALPYATKTGKRMLDGTSAKKLGHHRWVPLLTDYASESPLISCSDSNALSEFDEIDLMGVKSRCRYQHQRCAGWYNRQHRRKVELNEEEYHSILPDDMHIEGNENRFLLSRSPSEGVETFEFVMGIRDEAAIFKRTKETNENSDPISGQPTSADGLSKVLATILHDSVLDVDQLRLYFNKFHDRYSVVPLLSALAFSQTVYQGLKGATVSMEALMVSLQDMRWPRWLRTVQDESGRYLHNISSPGSDHSNSHGELSHRLAVSLACIAMFESGEFDIDPRALLGTFALSSGDSIYLTSAMTTDPALVTARGEVRRVLGNLGRPEMVFLVSAAKPMLGGCDLSSWRMVDHEPFDGLLLNSFTSTTLHLTLTDFEMPIDIGVRGLRDTQVVILESVVSLNDSGKHLGDLNIVSCLDNSTLSVDCACSPHLPLQGPTQGRDPTIVHRAGYLTSIDCWDEFFDFPLTKAIMRVSGNWQGRLAAVAAGIQKGKRVLLLPQHSCLTCLGDKRILQGFDLIIA
ncbi:uncharacterized protein FOBCDRAFT_275988 [Fusarium oxysporum Fo47]|uniref:uncharacterized protein n=1 Tax=Fusarium oxysporum Fo47 TaxID=660027 RepID=UPI00286992EC|nr:uncharacterized protein FOBCDRAFT_275988 [Fusarium oxysporum Fo47]QKD56413.2 hypothetical protein FOBCDRAFT_275988 [Fusarium oxysporum Fo47]